MYPKSLCSSPVSCLGEMDITKISNYVVIFEGQTNLRAKKLELS